MAKFIPRDYTRWYKDEIEKEGLFPDDEVYTLFRESKNKFITVPSLKHDMEHKIQENAHMANMICITFKVSSEIKSEYLKANYCFLYAMLSKDANTMDSSNDDVNYDNLTFYMYCTSPSLISQDGEFRNRLFRFSTIKNIYRKYRRQMMFIEDMLFKKIEVDELDLEYDIFYPTVEIEKKVSNVENIIARHRFKTKFFTIFWLSLMYNVQNDLQENHMNPIIGKLLMKNMTHDHMLYKKITDHINEKDFMWILAMTQREYVEKRDDEKMRLVNFVKGQKLIPLNVMEVQYPFNISHDTWKELYIGQELEKLVYNNICPSIPLLLSWFYLKNDKIGMFDNPQQYLKLENSDRSSAIITKLRESQRLGLNERKENINDLFEQLNNSIIPTIDFVKKHLLMSEVVLGFIVQNVGRTFYDIPKMMHTPLFKNAVGDVLKNHSIFEMYIWDVVYTIYCMRTCHGVVHNDLHLNNVTINNIRSYAIMGQKIARTFDDKKSDKIFNDKNVILYKVKNFYFKRSFWWHHAYIIDFSRAVVKPHNRHMNYMQQRGNGNDYNKFKNGQYDSMVHKLVKTFPSYWTRHKESLLNYDKSNFDSFFDIYALVDVYGFCTKLLKYFKIYKLNKKSETLLNKLITLTEVYLTRGLKTLVDTPIDNTDDPFVNILIDVFTDNIIDIAECKQLYDILWIWDSTNDVKNINLSNLTKLPSFVGDVKQKTKTNNISSMAIKNKHSKIKNAKENHQRKSESIDMIQYIARRHKEKYK